jgi:hypothetical protein
MSAHPIAYGIVMSCRYKRERDGGEGEEGTSLKDIYIYSFLFGVSDTVRLTRNNA